MSAATLHLSCAVSADGYLDDISSDRAILSSLEDLEAVLALRATMDMIVVGAETLRRDNPSLATRGAAHIATRKAVGLTPDPVKVVVTRSGDIPADRAFFQTGGGERIVLSAAPTDAPGTVVPLEGDPIDAILKVAEARGLQNVLIEGGVQMLKLALPRARHLRLAISPTKFDDRGYARLFDDVQGFLDPLQIIRSETLGETEVHHIDLWLTRAHSLMKQALDLSQDCPASEAAFAVGCIGCTEDLSVLATGYSRETGSKDHAEEAMLSKLSGAVPHTVICTLEPCLTRSSKPTGCSERLVSAGTKRLIYAVAEDETFVRQSGLKYLREHGVDVLHIPGFEAEFRRVNAPIYGSE